MSLCVFFIPLPVLSCRFSADEYFVPEGGFVDITVIIDGSTTSSVSKEITCSAGTATG